MQGIWSRSAWKFCNTRTPVKVVSQSLLNLDRQGGHPSRFLDASRTRSYSATSTLVDGVRPHVSSQAMGFQATFDGGTISKHISPNDVSRASAQAVRIACKQGMIPEAFAIVKSIHQAFHASSTTLTAESSTPPTATSLHPLLTGGNVSPRLASHALLHGLIRSGHTEKAGELAYSLLQRGTLVRTKSLEHAIGHLCSSGPGAATSNHETPVEPYGRPPKWTKGASPQLVENACTRLALQIFFAAKQHKQQRTKQMLQSLIDACLLQGEILVVSILFAFLIKQWQVRQAIEGGKTKVDVAAEMDPFPIEKSNWEGPDHDYHYPYPDRSFMTQTLSYIDASLCNKSMRDGSSVTTDQDTSVQALLILANLLDERLIPFEEVAILIRALHAYPAALGKLYARRGRIWRKENVQLYLQGVLDRLIDEVIASNKDPPDIRCKARNRLRMPLDRVSYNALLHYTLRHRMSPSRADAIIHHMAKRRDTSCHPNISTLNTLMRDATLLQRNDIVLKTLEFLKSNLSYLDSSQEVAVYDRIIRDIANTSSRVIGAGLKPKQPQYMTEHFELRIPQASTRRVRLNMNADTLNICISSVTAAGSPEAATEILFLLFPELRSKRRKMESRKQVVMRAARLGPRFITTMLNALSKAGRTDLAEKLWFIAREAETQSCNLALGPWCLPMEAYTVMLQIYAKESKKGSSCGTGDSTSAKMRVDSLGWGYPFRRVQRKLGQSAFTRREAARRMGWLLLKSFYDARAQTQEVATTSKHSERMALKAPDSRFFNAALKLFGVFGRQNKRPPSYWHRLIRRAEKMYISTGHLGPKPNSATLQILAAIRNEGLPIPALFSRPAIPSSLNAPQSVTHDLSVPLKPARYDEPPHSLPAFKTRGVHVSKGWKVGRLRRVHRSRKQS
ncbi:hypothetical protein SCHPADRAFT_543839 [Schizopora paradoxa]|uniref:Uncharacterized protein n=1 Tax=Schizopora paradoxa TaxID=27342 RepID=A0A0H2RYV8_9AGAM|nr:hypothetical protein SCHPADRAFT_543839 [Schizopora paradoxa]